ncbi:MAG: hypothetical protein M3178_06135 [Pseudomonadota bacterium]|nr:hypothetical protein [Pseudomonadota bacterium]
MATRSNEKSQPRAKMDKAQSNRFLEAAHKLGCDEDPAHFDEILKKVARHKPLLHVRPERKKPKTR